MKSKVWLIVTSISVLLILVGINMYKDNNKSNSTIRNISNSGNNAKQSRLATSDKLKQEFLLKLDDMHTIKLLGVKGKFGFTEQLFYVNTPGTTTLYLWGNENDLLNKQLKIIAVNNIGDTVDIPNLYKITKDGHGEVMEENSISAAREQVTISLPKSGNWLLQVYLDDILLGNTVIDVKNDSNEFIIPAPYQRKQLNYIN